MDEKPEDYSTESLISFAVQKERTGFEQATRKIAEFVDRKMKAVESMPLNEVYIWGMLAAYQDVLDYVKDAYDPE